MKVKKVVKKAPSPPRDVLALIKLIEQTPNDDLAPVLRQVKSWVYPRGDLQAWIPVLDKFDGFLADTIESYDLSKLQTNEFTPKTRETILEVLRFQRMLLESCTQRKLFASYDRLQDLLFTSDLDVLQATILVLLRPAQQYGSQTPYESATGAKIRQRLAVLARGWDKLRSRGFDMATLASSSALTLDDDFFTLTTPYYPASQPPPASPVSPSKSKSVKTPKRSSSITNDNKLDLGDVRETMLPDLADRLAMLSDTHNISLDDQMTIMNQVRVALSTRDRKVRAKLLSIRLLAIATFAFLASEDSVSSTLFLYEPELITQIAEILRHDDIDDITRASAITALDAFAHHSNKVPDVMAAIGPSVNHGILMTFFRNTVDRLLSSDPPAHELVDASFSLVGYIATSPSHGGMLLGPGFLPLLLKLLGTQCDRRDTYIPRAAGLLDSALMSGNLAVQVITGAGGINTLVTRVKAEVDLQLETTPPEPTEIMSEDTINTARTNPLKALLRSLQRLMASAGGAEGMRTLVDSDLPKTIKVIFQNYDKFGPRVYASAINILASFVHNEPTSLSFLQEIQLPQTLFENLERDFPKSFEVIAVVPNAIGAICLNEAGINYLKSHAAIIHNMITAAIVASPSDSMEREPSHQALGKSLDELVRHHPGLRPIVLDAVTQALKSSMKKAEAFVPSEDEKEDYEPSPGLASTQETAKDKAFSVNNMLEEVLHMWTIMLGLLRNSSVCKDFLETGGLDLFTQTVSSPAMPRSARGSQFGLVLDAVLRAIGEHDHVKATVHLRESVEKMMAECEDLWKSDDALANWTSLESGPATEHQDQMESYLKMTRLGQVLNLLASAMSPMSSSHARVAASLMTALGTKSGSTLLADLGSFQRICLQIIAENARPPPWASKTASDAKEVDPAPDTDKDKPSTGVVKLAPRLNTSIARFLKTITRLVYAKRTADTSHSAEATALSNAIAQIASSHLKSNETPPSVKVLAASITLVTSLLFDDRGVDGHLQMSLFEAFEKQGGLGVLWSSITQVLDAAESATSQPGSDRDDASRTHVADNMVALRSSMSICRALASVKAFESSQGFDRDPAQTIRPNERVTRLQHDIAPLANRAWDASWLVEAPIQVVKSVTQTFMAIMESPPAETSSDPGTEDAVRVVPIAQPRPAEADPSRVTQLVDMGFSRGAAEYALIRARNNVAAAADMILSMPHVFLTMDDALGDFGGDNPAPEASNEAAPGSEVAQPGDNAPSEPQINASEGDQAEPGPVNAGESSTDTVQEPVASDSNPETDQAASEPLSTTQEQTDISMEPEASDDKMEVDAPASLADIHTALDGMREKYRPNMATRALEILDAAEDLVFDLLPAFPKKDDGLLFLLQQTLPWTSDDSGSEATANASDEQKLSARLRMLSVFLRASPAITLNDELRQLAQDCLQRLTSRALSQPPWTPSFLFFVESVMVLSDQISEVKLGDESKTIVTSLHLDSTTSAELSNLCASVLDKDDSPRDIVIAALRVLVILTRRSPPSPQILTAALHPFQKPSAKISGCAPYVAMICRHGMENSTVLQEVMQMEITQWLSPARNKVSDIGHFVRQLRQVAARDPATFLKAASAECTLVDPTPPQSIYHIRAKEETDRQADEATKMDVETGHVGAGDELISLLLADLGKSVLVSTPEPGTQKATNNVSYAGLLLSILTELVGSYMQGKQGFIAAIGRNGLHSVTKARNHLNAVVGDLVCCVSLSTDLNGSADSKDSALGSKGRQLLSKWSTSLLVALCADVVPSQESKSSSESMTSIRRQTLDAIAKALKDPGTGDLSDRYGRLWAISELLYRLLLSRPTIGPPRPGDDSALVMAKMMLEKGFVGLLTNAAGDIDLNFPDVKTVLVSVLKTLEYLTKISIKWGKAEKPNGESSQTQARAETPSLDDDDDSILESDDEDMMDQDGPGPDLYRNSALGLMGGELREHELDEEDESDDEEDEDDEMMEVYDDDGYEGTMDEDDVHTVTSTFEDGEEEAMDHDDWTDDGSEDMADGDIPEVILGHDDGIEVEGDEGTWQDGLAMEDVDEDGFMPGDHDMDDIDPEEDYDEDDDEGEPDTDLEEEDYDGMDVLEPLSATGVAEAFDGPVPQELAGHWGWDGISGPASRHDRDGHRRGGRLLGRGADVDPEMGSMFGGPSRRRAPAVPPAQSSLVVENVNQPNLPSRRTLPRSLLSSFNDLIAGVGSAGGSVQEQALDLIERLLGRIGHHSRAVQIRLSGDDQGNIGLSIGDQSYNLAAPTSPRSPGPEADDITPEYIPKPSLQRWHEEMSVCPGNTPDVATRMVNHLVNLLLPAAKQRAEAAQEAAAKTAPVDQPEAQQSTSTQPHVEIIEPIATADETSGTSQTRDNDVAEPPVLEAESAEQVPTSDAPPASDMVIDQEEVVIIEPVPEPIVVEPEANAEAEAAPSTEAIAEADAGDPPAEPPAEEPVLARTFIQIRGQPVDITDSGIDLEFLQALPEEMQADVVEQHMREQERLRAPRPADAAAEAASGISAEFLDALPPEIRAEVVMQEAMANSRRNSAQPPVPLTPPHIPALHEQPLDFLSGLDADLRDVMLLGQGLGAGPAGLGIRGLQSMPGRRAILDPGRGESSATAEKAQREAVQLLERPGVAALVRLLFFPEGFKKSSLFKVLTNLCANSNTRSDLLNLMLSVVQDGTGDLSAVDKSFQQMSLRPPPVTPASKTTPKTPKASDSLTSASTSNLFARMPPDNIPTFIAQRCFEALAYIVSVNVLAVQYFLTEHDQPVGLKKPASKKGKGKDRMLPQTKFPIVILLELLDRTELLKATGMMESLTSLLSTVTRPLMTIKVEGDDKEKDVHVAQSARDDTQPEVPAEPSTPKVDATPTAPSTQALTTVKPAPLSFPSIPPSVLRLVVNCLTIGDCSSRNFSQTLLVMQHLSKIPDARPIIVDELKQRSRELGSAIKDELAAFSESLQTPGADMRSLSLDHFTPQSSKQAQLLRLFKAIEYIFLRLGKDDAPSTVTADEETLRGIYHDLDLDPLWVQLAESLDIVKEREDFEQIALILLPAVEALMVICKYRGQPQRELASPTSVTSPLLDPTTSTIDLDDLFTSFTTSHRKLLNAILRSNPSLLSGSFSLLIRNSKVLEFENKRSWFLQKLKRKRGEGPVPTVIHLNVRRQYIFQDSFHALNQRSGDEVKYGKLSVKFSHEDGIDAGGVTREWFTVLGQEIFDPNYALFEPCAADQQTYQPNKHSSVNDEHLGYFKFVGRVIGKAVYDGRLLDAYFNRAFYKQILGRSVDMRDLESIDPEYHKSLQWMLDNDITGIIDQEFTIEDDSFGEKTIVELKENGASIPVTEENKTEYVRQVVSYRLHHSIRDQLKAFLAGFYEIIPRDLVQIFEPEQLELLISGVTMVDVDELKNATQLSGYKSTDPEVSWFWRALRGFSQEQRSRFLMFVTSSSRVPLGGFTQLVGASGIQPFQIQKLYAKPGSLPQASTCFNLLLLPPYDSYEQLRDKLLLAVEEGGGFGKA